ncbi:MAG: ABC transporter permease, partial [Dehalococcoidales bacterium]
MAEDTTGLYIGQLATDKPHSFLVDLAIRLVKEKPLGTVGALIVLMLLIVGIFAHWIAPWGYEDGFWTTGASRLEPMSWDYWLGADQLGRDVLSRIIWGARISMFVGLGVSILSTLISGFIGVISGYLGGKADLVIQRLVDSWMAFPDILILITLMALVGPGIPQVIVVLGILYGITGSRTIRAATIGIKSNVYLEAARAIGAPTRTILWKHVLPNIMAPLIIVFTSRMGAAILAEASISFLGYG